MLRQITRKVSLSFAIAGSVFLSMGFSHSGKSVAGNLALTDQADAKGFDVVVKKRPNILLIIADDLGYSDLGAFGGEIETPVLDGLAHKGIKLTNFHVGSTCSPTRAMLFSGVDNHQAGLGNMSELVTDEQRGEPGYEGYLNNRVVTVASLLRDAGYHTSIAGKWHLGHEESQSPKARGFEESFVLLQGGASHFDQTAIINVDPVAKYRENGKLVDLPNDFYSTAFYTDKTLEYIANSDQVGKPFFAVAAYTAPHWPLHAPDKFIEKYEGVYSAGYAKVRQHRLERMAALGIVNPAHSVDTGFAQWPRWDELSESQKAEEAKKMQVYAAMVDNLDHHVGRLVAQLEKSGELDNTFILFMSDNGADGNNPRDLAGNAKWIDETFDNSLENLGKAGSYVAYGPGWGQVSATPYRLYKGFTSEGGLVAPAIIHYPNMQRDREISHEFINVLDLAPTLLELADVEHPRNYRNRTIHPLQGKSLWPYLSGVSDRIHANGDVVGWEFLGRRAIRKGNWKLLQLNEPWGKGRWELYNLEADPAESMDLAADMPGKVTELVAEWKRYVAEKGVLLSKEIKVKYANSESYYRP